MFGYRRLGFGSGISFLGILDQIDTFPVNAWDIGHRLYSGYKGAACRIIRASDSVEEDFYYLSDGTLNTTGIADFISGTTGDFVTVYDQIGSNDLEQDTAADQPLYTATGFNGGPGADCNGTDHHFSADAIASSFAGTDVPFQIFGAVEWDAHTFDNMYSFASTADTVPIHIFRADSAGPEYNTFRQGDTGSIQSMGSFGVNCDNDPHIITSTFFGTTADTWEDTTHAANGGGMDANDCTFNTFTLCGMVRSDGFGGGLDGRFAGAVLLDTTMDDTNTDAFIDLYIALKGI